MVTEFQKTKEGMEGQRLGFNTRRRRFSNRHQIGRTFPRRQRHLSLFYTEFTHILGMEEMLVMYSGLPHLGHNRIWMDCFLVDYISSGLDQIPLSSGLFYLGKPFLSQAIIHSLKRLVQSRWHPWLRLLLELWPLLQPITFVVINFLFGFGFWSISPHDW